MGFFTKLFGFNKAKSLPNQSPVSVSISTSWHYTGEGDCPAPRALSCVEITGPAPQDSFGFFNLGVYQVTGHIINPNTNRKNKKSMKVYALSASEAESTASASGILPPFTVEISNRLNTPPNEYQTANAKEYGIEVPFGAVDADVRTMVERGSDVSPTSEFAKFCTDNRILFSRYIGETDLIRTAYDCLPQRDRVALYAYAVLCALSENRIGDPRNYPICYSFADNADSSLVSLIEKRGSSDLPRPRRGTNAWLAISNYFDSANNL